MDRCSRKERLTRIVERLLGGEEALRQRAILAPLARAGAIRARVAGLIYTFRAEPSGFEGFGIFKPLDAGRARVVSEASPSQAERYLSMLRAFRLILIHPIAGRTWLAGPSGPPEAVGRRGRAIPRAVHLVEGAEAFDQAVARFDGTSLWFERIDRCADPRISAALRRSLASGVTSGDLSIPGLTPELRSAYAVARGEAAILSAPEARLQKSIERSGGTVVDLRDRGDAWLVDLRSPRGEIYSSIIRKSEFTVLSAGICLSGADEEFDAQSLVSVLDEFERGG